MAGLPLVQGDGYAGPNRRPLRRFASPAFNRGRGKTFSPGIPFAGTGSVFRRPVGENTFRCVLEISMTVEQASRGRIERARSGSGKGEERRRSRVEIRGQCMEKGNPLSRQFNLSASSAAGGIPRNPLFLDGSRQRCWRIPRGRFGEVCSVTMSGKRRRRL